MERTEQIKSRILKWKLSNPDILESQVILLSSMKGKKVRQNNLLLTTLDRDSNIVKAGFLLNELLFAALKNESSQDKFRQLTKSLIPPEFVEYIRKEKILILKLDEYTSQFPWELILQAQFGEKLLNTSFGTIRQLDNAGASQPYRKSSNSRVLVIGDPKLYGYITQLPGAKQEAEMVAKLLSRGDAFEVNNLINTEYKDVILEIFSDEYRILHLAGHGIVDEKKGNVGMVIGDGHFLKANDVKQLSKVPELVFINCCHLGHIDSSDSKFYRDRNKLAASLSTQFIMSGAKAVKSSNCCWMGDQ